MGYIWGCPVFVFSIALLLYVFHPRRQHAYQPMFVFSQKITLNRNPKTKIKFSIISHTQLCVLVRSYASVIIYVAIMLS